MSSPPAISVSTDIEPVLAVLRTGKQVLFGEGQRTGVGTATAELGRRALLCTDRRMAGDPMFAEIVASVERAGVHAEVFGDVQPELPVASVVACADGIADAPPDVIIGVGGGSCIDHAKLVALLCTHGGDLRDYYGELAVPGPILPVIAIPTTSGTGSEVTPVAVVSDPDRAMKVGVSSPYLIPHTAILDPELTYTCPAGLTASTAADALAHCVEAYTAVRRPPTSTLATERVFIGKSVFTDQFALAGIHLIATNLLRVHRDPQDAIGRRELQLGSWCGGLALASGGTTVGHALQYPVGALTGTAHGTGVGTLLPYVMEFNRGARHAELDRIATAFGVSPTDTDDRSDAAIDAVATLLGQVGIPPTLAGLGVRSEEIGWIAEHAMTARRLIENNPVALDITAVEALARAAYTGDREALRPAR